MPEAIFRFDAAPATGFGHAVRCSALAGHLRALGWRSSAAIRTDAAPSGPWLKGFDRVVTLPSTDADEPAALRAAAGGACDLLVVDHYGWEARRERACREWTKMIAAIDDLADRDHDCDLLCDSNLTWQPKDYSARIPAGAKLLLGPRYALLRDGFAKARHRLNRSAGGAGQRLFVNIGATDSTGLLPIIVDGIARAGFDGAVDIVIAAQAPGRVALTQKLAAAPFPGRLHVDAGTVPTLMAQADLAIGAAGATAWERCCLGLPSLVVIAADNQRHVAAGLMAAGAVQLLEPGFTAGSLAAALAPLLRACDARAAMAARAGRLCDGLGCGRMAEALLFPTNGVTLRPVEPGDCDIVLQWQGEPGARRFAREPRVPSVPEHAAWFAAKLDHPSCVFHIVEVGKTPAGFLRLDYRPDTDSYEVSILVAQAFRGRGAAGAALGIVRRMLPWAELRAWVRPENVVSVGLFREAGYGEIAKPGEGIWFVSSPLTAARSRHPELTQ